jgi:hypothetical protein
MLGGKNIFYARQVYLAAHKTKFWRRERKVRFGVVVTHRRGDTEIPTAAKKEG